MIRKVAVNACRFVLSLTLVFSGYVKAIDPLGTQYKIEDYSQALGMGALLPDWLTLGASVALSALEFTLGIFLLFAMRRRQSSLAALVLMGVMTVVSVWIAIANPVSDCGCFGDAIVLTNGETLLKNIVLLACAAVVWRYPMEMVRLMPRKVQWMAINASVIFVLLTSLWCLYDLPLIDFRPYHVGADIRQGMTIPEGAAQPQFETTFILEKDGERREFSLQDYPDSTWTFVDSKTVQTSEGYTPPIHDFSIEDRRSGDDLTEQILSDPGYTFLLVSPYLEKADDSHFGDIDQIYEFTQEEQLRMYCLTASSDDAVQRWIDLTGAEYPFCTTDATTLKTIIRSNPGLVLLKGGIIVGKWSHNRLPDEEQLRKLLSNFIIKK